MSYPIWLFGICVPCDFVVTNLYGVLYSSEYLYRTFVYLLVEYKRKHYLGAGIIRKDRAGFIHLFRFISTENRRGRVSS